MMDGARVIAKFFKRSGIDRAYGVPGEDHMQLLSAFEEEGIRYVLAREESAACIMAATEAQVTGKPGLCVVSVAAGISNAINGIAHAYLDRIPLLILCGQHGRSRLPVTVRQALDNQRLVQAVTKWAVSLGGAVGQVLHKAVDVAMTPPRGPVFIELTEQEMTAEVEADASATWEGWRGGWSFQGGLGAVVDEARRMLRASRRPVLIVGGGTYSGEERLALTRLAERYGLVTFTSAAAKGTFPSSYPLSAGTFLGGRIESSLLDTADLIVTVSLGANEFYNRPWKYSAPVISINQTHETAGLIPMEYELCGDVRQIAWALADTKDLPGASSEWTVEQVRAYRREVEAAVAGRPDGRLTIAEAVRAIKRILPEDTLVAVDAGFSKPIVHMLWEPGEPGEYFASHGLSTMGFALPAANALQLLHPDRRVVAFTGDGSLLMRATEIATAVELGAAPIYVAFVDGALTQIAVKQRRQGLVEVGTRLPTLSCEKIADAFGGVGFDVQTLAELEGAVREAVGRSRPALVGVRVDQSAAERIFDALRG